MSQGQELILIYLISHLIKGDGRTRMEAPPPHQSTTQRNLPDSFQAASVPCVQVVPQREWVQTQVLRQTETINICKYMQMMMNGAALTDE